MPFVNEHAARQTNPADYESFRSMDVEGAPGVRFVLGIKPGGGSEVQSVRFDAARFSADAARAWLGEHDYLASGFEPAEKIHVEAEDEAEDEVEDEAEDEEEAPAPAPAQEAKGRACFKAVKEDKDQGLVFGWLYVAQDGNGDTVVDHSGEFVPPDELEKAFYDYVERSGIAGEQHRKIGVGRLVEACMVTPEKLDAMKDASGQLPRAAAWVGYRIHDPDTLEKFRNGKLPQFSMAGSWDRVPVDEQGNPRAPGSGA